MRYTECVAFSEADGCHINCAHRLRDRFVRVLRSIAQSWLLTVLSLLAVGALSVTAVIAAEDGEKTWQGNWKNFR